jgi:hypothetical protein
VRIPLRRNPDSTKFEMLTFSNIFSVKVLSCSGRVKGGLRAGLIDRAVEHVLSLHFTIQESQLCMPHKFSGVANPDPESGVFFTRGSRALDPGRCRNQPIIWVKNSFQLNQIFCTYQLIK